MSGPFPLIADGSRLMRFVVAAHLQAARVRGKLRSSRLCLPMIGKPFAFPVDRKETRRLRLPGEA